MRHVSSPLHGLPYWMPLACSWQKGLTSISLDLLVFYTGEALLNMLETCRAEYHRRPRAPPTRLLMPGDATSMADSAGQYPHLIDTVVTCQSSCAIDVFGICTILAACMRRFLTVLLPRCALFVNS